jgi:hypothetical protein
VEGFKGLVIGEGRVREEARWTVQGWRVSRGNFAEIEVSKS